MRPSLKALSKRAAEKARETAAGSPVPAGQEPPPDAADARPSAAERASMRRRVRKIARLRDARTRELGGLLVEMERLGRRNDELISRRTREIAALDEELRGLGVALGERHTLGQVVAAGVAGECKSCHSLLGIEDRFCARCGVAAGAEAAAPPPPPPPPRPSDDQLQIQTVGADRK